MENRLYLYNLGIKTFGGFATLGGVIQALQLFTQPDLDIKSILLSFPAWVVYVFVCLTIIFAMLRERYKSMSHLLYLQLIIPQYFISNKSGIWSLSLIVHSKG